MAGVAVHSRGEEGKPPHDSLDEPEVVRETCQNAALGPASGLNTVVGVRSAIGVVQIGVGVVEVPEEPGKVEGELMLAVRDTFDIHSRDLEEPVDM